MTDEPKPPAQVVPLSARPLIADDIEDGFAAAMRRMAAPTLETDEADAEYTAAEALKLSAARPVVPGPGEDDMPIPMPYEGED
ncbi:hypothetical protein [Phenylobacterium sp.]|uniref:hypothetical protein n=1 Tax=Phenylobacterium sp. TaxID=1871053 RepID=UPI002BD11A71|nr:hypothetical protein [Phenylobacterium sp.]HLZ74519.1 hypothetical protein [Phenylobacterium sp.]